MHVIRGDVAVKLGNRRLKARPGDTLLVPIGTMHRDEFDLSIGLEVFYVFFDWPPSKDYFRIVPLKAVPRLCAPITAEIGKMCGRMQTGLNTGTETDRLLISSYTHNILLLILREALRSDKRRNFDDQGRHGDVLLLKARQYIDLHYAEQISLDHIADSLGISPFYLSHLFSRQSDFSFVGYLTQVRMQKAKNLLAGGVKNVSEAAYAVGYNDGNYFSKVFRRYFGINPRAARCGPSGKTRATR
jgi:AraC-like DNA-binding protein